jgi:Serine/threonine protein kinase
MTIHDQGIPNAPLGSRYRLDRRIGSGGMAEVFAGTDLVLERRVAVKRLSPALVGDAVALQRFQREARALASTHDPNVVAVFDVGQDQDGPYLVMELVEGITLRTVLDREGPLEPARALRIAAAVAQGLAAVHGRGVVHRDVKPSNVFVTNDGQVKIGDFGIARIAEGSAVTRSGEVLGSAPYIAPEQLTGGKVGPPADLYGLGCILFEMLTGRPPFEGEDPVALTYRHVHEKPPRLDAIRQGIPLPVAGLVEGLLAKDPDDRPKSADDARRLLVEAASSLPDHTPGEATTEPLDASNYEGGANTERLEPRPTAPLPPPIPATVPLTSLAPGPSAPPPRPGPGGAEPGAAPPWLPWALGGAAVFLVLVLLAAFLIGGHQGAAPHQTSAGQRSQSTSASASASASVTVTPESAGAALVDLSNRLAAAGEIGQDIASNVQHTVDEVLRRAGGGGGDQQHMLDQLSEKIDNGLEKGHVASADAARSLHQALDDFANALSHAQG